MIIDSATLPRYTKTSPLTATGTSPAGKGWTHARPYGRHAYARPNLTHSTGRDSAMRVTYTKRLGQNSKGHTRDLSDTEAAWLIDRGHARMADTDTESATDAPAPTPAPEDAPDLDTATLADLKAHADALGLPTYGTKAQLAARIADHQDS